MPEIDASALQIIDMISPLEFDGGQRLLKQALPAAECMVRRKRRRKNARCPVLYCNDNFGRWRSNLHHLVQSSLDEGSRGRPLAQLLMPDANDDFVLKPQHSACFSTPLEKLLRCSAWRAGQVSGSGVSLRPPLTIRPRYVDAAEGTCMRCRSRSRVPSIRRRWRVGTATARAVVRAVVFRGSGAGRPRHLRPGDRQEALSTVPLRARSGDTAGPVRLAAQRRPPMPSTSIVIPAHWPRWSRRMAELYFSGTTAMFVLHGNTADWVPLGGGKYGSVTDFLSTQMFGRWDLVLGYDLARGLKVLGGSSPERQREMVILLSRKLADLDKVPRDPALVMALLDRLVQENLVAKESERVRFALLVDYASFLVPPNDRATPAHQIKLVTFLNWASNPYIKQSNMAFALIDGRSADFNDRLTGSTHISTLQLPLPEEDQRRAYLEVLTGADDLPSYSDFDVPTLAKLTAGTALTDLEVLIRSSRETRTRLDEKHFKARKKVLIERQAQDLLEFIEPKFGLEFVVGHEAAKKRLLDDAELIKRGRLDVAPMGYLFNGPVGTGKTFLATALAGSIGIPCVKLKNFRSKYVGETEANLERILSVLKGMGPVMVIIDEADAMLGDRDQGGESGVGARVFGMIANAMGDTEYRGKIIWMLLTARPDLLPVDLKRQGRAEIHVPLFYPQSQDEVKQYFVVIAKKFGAPLPLEEVPDVPHLGHLSGADIEGLVGRAWRSALLAGKTQLDRELLTQVLAGFMPSTQTLEREMQELAAIIECTEREFLVPSALARLEAAGGREGLQQRLNQLLAMVG